MDIYKVLYDSIQIMTDNEELNRLMDKHQLEEHKRLLSEHAKTLVFTLVAVFFLFDDYMCLFVLCGMIEKKEVLYSFAT